MRPVFSEAFRHFLRSCPVRYDGVASDRTWAHNDAQASAGRLQAPGSLRRFRPRRNPNFLEAMGHLEMLSPARAILLVFFAAAPPPSDFVLPTIEGPWWRVAGNPDLGAYTSERQQPVDFAVWQAADGTWQLWSCIRHTKLGGHTRLFHRWEGAALTDSEWKPKGIALLADPALGEPLGGLQAPHVVQWRGKYWMAYGDWDHIRFAVSDDGKEFRRALEVGRFGEGPHANTRDPMLLYTRGKWHCYYTAFPAGRGYVFCRTSEDLVRWSDPVIVSYGGAAGQGPFSCECPHVVELAPGDYFLFRTQYYGPGAQTTVYRSENPYLFGIDEDSRFVTQLNVCAPEIVLHDGRYYLAALEPGLDGIRIVRLRWMSFGRARFDFGQEAECQRWKRAAGDVPVPFVRSDGNAPSWKPACFVSTRGPSEAPETCTGVVESPEFEVDSADSLLLLRSGGGEGVHVVIVDSATGEERVRANTTKANVWVPALVDCRKLAGRRLKIRVVDSSRDPGGWIEFGGLWAHTPEGDR